jgi:hypothetical protein
MINAPKAYGQTLSGLPSIAQEIETIRTRNANSLHALICRVGIGCFSEGTLSEEWKSDVDPEDYFESMHISIS